MNRSGVPAQAHQAIGQKEASHTGVWLTDDSRRMPVFLAAGPGSGKSRLLGRLLAWQDFINGVPLVILDPHGVTIDNFIDKLSRLPEQFPEHVRRTLWQRIRYVDVSGYYGSVVPFPLYYRLGGESHYEMAARYIDVIGKVDPHLQTASIEGFNAIKQVGTMVGMLLAALECQITEAMDLLHSPEQWVERIRSRLDVNPFALRPVFSFWRSYAALNEGGRQRLNSSFMRKIEPFRLETGLAAMFGAPEPGINWPEVVDRRLAVLLDFRHVHDLERRQFLMMWVYHYFMTFIRSRGPGRHQPISFIVDELAALFPISGLVADHFAGDLDEMINQIARNYGMWLTLATQELYQFSERLQKTLLSMTLIQGRTSDPEAAAMLAQRLSRYEPYLVKRYENVWMSMMFNVFVVDKRPVEFTPEEQLILQSYRYQDLRKFEFLVRLPRGEGDLSGGIRQMSIAGLDPGQFPDEGLVAEARARLAVRDGHPIPSILAEIERRLQHAHKPTQPSLPDEPLPALPFAIPASGEIDLR